LIKKFFLRKINNKIDLARDELRLSIERNLFSSDIFDKESNTRYYYLSKVWLYKLRNFAEPGPIDNSDVICQHGRVHPHMWKCIDRLTVKCSSQMWTHLVSTFGLQNSYSALNNQQSVFDLHTYLNLSHTINKNGVKLYLDCTRLAACRRCYLENESIKKRKINEWKDYLNLQERWKAQQLTALASNDVELQLKSMRNTYFINSNWLKQWEKFVQSINRVSSYEFPDRINNLTICTSVILNEEDTSKRKIYYLLKKSIFIRY
jgi:hypothetical protein